VAVLVRTLLNALDQAALRRGLSEAAFRGGLFVWQNAYRQSAFIASTLGAHEVDAALLA